VPYAVDAPPSDENAKQILEAILPLIREMAGVVFTPDRLNQLVGQLQDYRNARFAAGDAQTSAWAHSALTYVREEDDPSLNRFLVALCFHSLNRAVEMGLDQKPESEDEDTAEP